MQDLIQAALADRKFDTLGEALGAVEEILGEGFAVEGEAAGDNLVVRVTPAVHTFHVRGLFK